MFPYQVAFFDRFPFGAVVAGPLDDVKISICVFDDKMKVLTARWPGQRER